MATRRKPAAGSFNQAIRSAAEISDRALEYLASPWVPAAELTLLVGDAGIGKSTFATHIAARIAGKDATNQTLLLSLEDYAEIIKSRLRASSTDFPHPAQTLERVFLLDDLDPSCAYPHGLEELRTLVQETERQRGGKIRLVILDPILSFLKDGAGTYLKARKEATALRQWCRTTGTAVLGVIHRTKSRTSMRGSGALEEVARNILSISHDRGSNFETRLMSLQKASYNKPIPARKFTLDEGRINWS